MLKKRIGHVLFCVPVVTYGALIFYSSSQPAPELLPSFQASDKIYHFFAYCIMAMLWRLALHPYESLRFNGKGWALAIAFTILFAISDEIHQSFVAYRVADVYDALSDSLGALVAPVPYHFFRKRIPSSLKFIYSRNLL